MKKLTIIAALAMAAAAFALPSTASAGVWTHNHNDTQSGQNPQIHGEGWARFQSQVLQIECTTVTSTAQLTGGQTTGHINSFTAANVEDKCHTSNHCVVTSVSTVGTPWTAHVNGSGVQVTGAHINNDLHGLFCPDITLEILTGDGVTLTGEENGSTGHQTIDALHIEGTMTATPLEPQVTIQGTITATSSDDDTWGWT